MVSINDDTYAPVEVVVEPQYGEYPILITTVVLGESSAVTTLIEVFYTKPSADEAIFQVNNNNDAQGRYEQTAIALYRP